MSSPTTVPNREPEILSRLQLPITPEVAQSLVDIKFSPSDVTRMHELLDKGNEGTITPEEREEANSYERIGHLVAMLQSLARRTLKNPPSQ